jgi:hypothetical protein
MFYFSTSLPHIHIYTFFLRFFKFYFASVLLFSFVAFYLSLIICFITFIMLFPGIIRFFITHTHEHFDSLDRILYSRVYSSVFGLSRYVGRKAKFSGSILWHRSQQIIGFLEMRYNFLMYLFMTSHMPDMRRAIIVYLYITIFETFKYSLFSSFKNTIM